jgi:tRNA pseudouridine65 synthase
MLEILYQDEHVVAINKPHGLLVHRSPMAKDATEFALQKLRDQLNQQVYPVHRLDRKTSGVLLFALDPESLKLLSQQFEAGTINKTYLALLRGYTEDTGTIDYAITNDAGKVQEAITHYKTLDKSEIDYPFGKHETSRYSLVEAKPETGRYHQLRKHFAHILHPIIADRAHGCNKQNRFFKATWDMTTMLLHAKSLTFDHPETGDRIKIEATIGSEFLRMMKLMEFDHSSFPTSILPS